MAASSAPITVKPPRRCILTSGYVYDDAEQAEATFAGTIEHYQYSRFANPTLTMLEQRLCLIEGAEDMPNNRDRHGRGQRRAAVAPEDR